MSTPPLVRQSEAGRYYYRLFVTLDGTDAGGAALAFLGPRDVVERPIYEAEWRGCGAPSTVLSK